MQASANGRQADAERLAAGVSLADMPRVYRALMQMYDEQKITHRESLSTKLDYRPAPRTKLSFTGQWNWYDLTFNGRSITFNSGTPVAGFSPNRVSSTPGTGNVTTDVSQRNKYGPTYALGTQFTHDFTNGKLSGGVSWSQAENKYRDVTKGFLTSVGLNLLRPAGSNTIVTMDNIVNQSPLPNISVTQNGVAPDYRDLSNYSIGADTWRTRPFTSRELKLGGNLDYRHSFKWAIPVAVQTGIRRDDTGRKIKREGFTASHPALTGSALDAYRDDDYSSEDIGFGFGALEWLSPYKTYSAFSNITGTSTENVVRDIEEKNDAFYLRFDLRLTEQLTAVTGARYEEKTMDATAQDLRVARQRLTTAHLGYDGWYPSLNLKYTPRNDVVVRAGASRTIGHPDFADIIPTVTDFDSTSTTSFGSISVPNPDIKPYKVTNLDLTGEWYLSSSGVVSASLFQKKVDGFISRGAVGVLDSLPVGPQIAEEYGISPADMSRYNVTFARNGAGSTVRGLEFSYSQGLSFLPKPFNTMNVQANFTRVRITGETFAVRLAQLQGATTKSANFILGWRLGRWNLLTTVHYTGEVETAFGANITAASTFTEEVTKTDVTVNYTVNSRATIYLQVRNVFGEGRSEYQTPSDPALFRSFRVPSRYSEYGEPSCSCDQLEDVILPGTHIQVEPACAQVVAVALVRRVTGQVAQAPTPPREPGERKPEIALAPVRREVHRDEQPLAVCGLPRERYEALRGPVPIPGARALDQPPAPLAHRGPAQHIEQPAVESSQPVVHRLVRPTAQMGGDARFPSFELPLVEKSQPGRQEGDDGSRLVNPRCKSSGDPRLVVVLEEPGELALIVESRPQMVLYRPSLSGA